jgi:hypothetical protein
MRIPPWRLALTGAAILILLAVGIGLVAASTGAARTTPGAAQAAASTAPGGQVGPNGAAGINGLGAFLKGRGLRLGFARRLVHVSATVTDANGNLIQLQLDHGTIQAIGAGTLSISEAGGSTVTVTTDSTTVVRIGRQLGTLRDLKVGQQVFVQSRVNGGTTLAKHILEVPATAAT